MTRERARQSVESFFDIKAMDKDMICCRVNTLPDYYDGHLAVSYRGRLVGDLTDGELIEVLADEGWIDQLADEVIALS